MVLLTGSRSVSKVVTGTLEYWPRMPLAQPVFQLCGLFLLLRSFVVVRKLIMQYKVTSTSLGLSVVS